MIWRDVVIVLLIALNVWQFWKRLLAARWINAMTGDLSLAVTEARALRDDLKGVARERAQPKQLIVVSPHTLGTTLGIRE